MTDRELPPLPTPYCYEFREPRERYTAEQMRAYASQAVAAERERCAGEIVELANLIAERDHLANVVEFIGTADLAGELFPVGPSDVEYAADGNTVMRYVGPWHFLAGRGDTFLAAVEDAMQKA